MNVISDNKNDPFIHIVRALNHPQTWDMDHRYIGQKNVGSFSDVDFSDHSQLALRQFTAEKYLYFQLRKAFHRSDKTQQLVKVQTVYGDFYVDASQAAVWHKNSLQQIRNLHRLAFFANSVLKTIKKKPSLADLNCFRYDELIWNSAIEASKGRIAKGANITNPVNLLMWPDLTRLKKFRHMVRIISLWSRKAHSLQATGVVLGIPQRYVLTVYTALQALDAVTTQPVQTTL